MLWGLILAAITILLLVRLLRSPVQCLCQKSASAARPPVSHPEAILDECTDDSSSEEDSDSAAQQRSDIPAQDMEWEKTPEE